jgi:hypothetical protein
MTHIITPHRITNQTPRDKNFILRGVPENASRAILQRVSPELEVVKASAKNAATFVNNELQSKLKRSKSAGEQLTELLEPSREALKRDRQAAARIVALRKAQEAAAGIKSGRRASSPKQLAALQSLVSLPPGINFLSPPWDFNFYNPNPPNFPYEFANGNVFSETGLYVATRDSYSGEIFGDGGSGSASAGFGFFVSSPIDRTAAFRPFMPYDYRWDDDSTFGYTAHTSGGPAFIVYEAGAPNPSKSIFLDLWNDGTSWSHDGDDQNGYMLESFDGENNSFPMTAGVTYLIIFLIWGYADCDGIEFDIFGSIAGSVSAFNMTANLDFIAVV